MLPHEVDGQSLRLGVWLMPDNRRGGMLEDFLAKLVPSGDACWAHADTSTGQARNLGAPLAPVHHAKGVLHTWLAWRAVPGLPFGIALNSQVLGHDSLEALAFVRWFNRLFVDP